MMDIEQVLLQWFTDSLIKKCSGSSTRNKNISNKELAKVFYKPLIRIFKKRKVHSPFIYNNCGADLADIQLISKFNKGIGFFLMCY